MRDEEELVQGFRADEEDLLTNGLIFTRQDKNELETRGEFSIELL